jgi:hypothetical protein
MVEKIGSKSNPTNQGIKAGVVKELDQLSHSVQNDQVFHFLILLSFFFSLISTLYRVFLSLQAKFLEFLKYNFMPKKKNILWHSICCVLR